MAQMVKICLQCRRPGFDSSVRKMRYRREMTIQSSILAWRIPWTEEPGSLQSLGLDKELGMSE